ncbi:MAG: hypothetical protein QW416_07780 [Candidatus Nitrosocaldaceae archaeon]
MDWRFTLIGVSMIAVGAALSLTFTNLSNIGPLETFSQWRMASQLGGILAALGVLVLIVSFGLRRKKRL